MDSPVVNHVFAFSAFVLRYFAARSAPSLLGDIEPGQGNPAVLGSRFCCLVRIYITVCARKGLALQL
jgi:hypothetical protein